MKKPVVTEFYREQFQMFKDALPPIEADAQLASDILEQVGKACHTVLELGAGNGLLARSLAASGRQVTAVELIPELVAYLEHFKVKNLTAICGDFNELDLQETYDLVLYIDGFGVGTDKEQVSLLKRIHTWLKDDGRALIDIYNPNYWRKASGQQMRPFPSDVISRIYGFDEESNRMTDTWWDDRAPEQAYTQSLACYTPEEIEALCQEAQLQIVAYFPGGAMDFETWHYTEIASMSDCLSYRIKVQKKKD